MQNPTPPQDPLRPGLPKFHRGGISRIFPWSRGLAAAVCFWGGIASDSTLAGEGVFSAGREIPEARDARLSLHLGVVSELEALVEETQRAYYDASGQSFKQELRESFSTDDFALDDGYPALGLIYEKLGKYITFQAELLVMDVDADATAQRNYYLGVEEIEFGGQTYEHMKIPEGSRFSMEFQGGFLDLHGLITPVTLAPVKGLRFTPWVDLGLFLFAGRYEIDAGPATGVVEYMDPPEHHVVGGNADGLVGAGVPQIGLGGELRLGNDDGMVLSLQGGYTMFKYDGSTSYFTTADHREKDLDLHYDSLRAGLTLELPLESGRAILVGLRYRSLEAEGTLESKDRTREEVIARRERFDKKADLKIESITGMIGFTF